MASITNSLVSQPLPSPNFGQRPLKAVLPPITQQQVNTQVLYSYFMYLPVGVIIIVHFTFLFAVNLSGYKDFFKMVFCLVWYVLSLEHWRCCAAHQRNLIPVFYQSETLRGGRFRAVPGKNILWLSQVKIFKGIVNEFQKTFCLLDSCQF